MALVAYKFNANPLAPSVVLGNPAFARFARGVGKIATLRFAAAQILSQFRGQTLLARQIIAFGVTHAKRLADIGPQVQAPLDIGATPNDRRAS